MIEGVAERRAVDAVLGQYELIVDEVTPVRFTNNAVFRLHTAVGDLALRIHRPDYRTPWQTRSELTYMEALAESGCVEVPLPVRTRSGDLVAMVGANGQRRHASVVTWLKGEVRRPGRGAGPKTLFRIGRALGHIHEFSQSFEAPAGFDLPTWDLSAIFEQSLVDQLESTDQQRIFDEVRQRAAVLFDGLGRSAAAFGVLHHDFILLNCLHHGRRTAVIDFDDCGWGFYLQDLGGLLGNLKDYANYRSLRRPFLDGYRSVRPMPSEAEQDLELMIALRHCSGTLWLLDRQQEDAMPEDQFRRIMTYRIEEIESSLKTLSGSRTAATWRS